MLNTTELKSLVELRIKLLHYWQKFPEEASDKALLNNWQNLLDKMILQERKRIDYAGGQNGNKEI